MIAHINIKGDDADTTSTFFIVIREFSIQFLV